MFLKKHLFIQLHFVKTNIYLFNVAQSHFQSRSARGLKGEKEALLHTKDMQVLTDD